MEFGDDIFMKKILMIFLLMIGFFSFPHEAGLNRWIKVKGDNVNLGTIKELGFEVNEILMFAQENSQKSNIAFGTCDTKVGGEAITVIFEKKYAQYEIKLSFSMSSR